MRLDEERRIEFLRAKGLDAFERPISKLPPGWKYDRATDSWGNGVKRISAEDLAHLTIDEIARKSK